MVTHRSPVHLEFQANRKVVGEGGRLRAAVRRISFANTGDDRAQTVTLPGVDEGPGSLDCSQSWTAALTVSQTDTGWPWRPDGDRGGRDRALHGGAEHSAFAGSVGLQPRSRRERGDCGHDAGFADGPDRWLHTDRDNVRDRRFGNDLDGGQQR